MGADAVHAAIITHRICGGFSDIRSCRESGGREHTPAPAPYPSTPY
jgi:hypothetical protein